MKKRQKISKEKTKMIKINGVKTKVILPRKIEIKMFPTDIRTFKREIKGLVCTL